MFYLILVSFVWAFSFGLTKNYLTGLDSNFISFMRLAIALLVFLPFLRLKGISKKQILQLLFIGAVEYGIMYLAYNASFKYLQAYEVALFTIFTPLYVTLIQDISERRLHPFTLLAVALATIGTAIVRWNHVPNSTLLGFLFVQISNLGFALGLVLYRQIMNNLPQLKDAQIFALLYLGGAVLSGIFSGYSLVNGLQIEKEYSASEPQPLRHISGLDF